MIVSKISNQKYIVECSGATTSVFTLDYKLIVQFTNMNYAYYPCLLPNDTLWVKSNTGYLSIYDINNKKVIKKWKSTKLADEYIVLSNYHQFVIEKEYFYNYQFTTNLKFYDATTMELVHKIFIDRYVQDIYPYDSYYYLLNSKYDENEDNATCYLSKWNGKQIIEEKIISSEELFILSTLIKKELFGIDRPYQDLLAKYEEIHFDMKQIFKNGLKLQRKEDDNVHERDEDIQCMAKLSNVLYDLKKQEQILDSDEDLFDDVVKLQLVEKTKYNEYTFQVYQLNKKIGSISYHMNSEMALSYQLDETQYLNNILSLILKFIKRHSTEPILLRSDNPNILKYVNNSGYDCYEYDCHTYKIFLEGYEQAFQEVLKQLKTFNISKRIATRAATLICNKRKLTIQEEQECNDLVANINSTNPSRTKLESEFIASKYVEGILLIQESEKLLEINKVDIDLLNPELIIINDCSYDLDQYGKNGQEIVIEIEGELSESTKKNTVLKLIKQKILKLRQ